MDMDAFAARVARGMYDNDPASRALGMELVEVRRGYARLVMRVREDMANGHAICHGGHIFTLADSAFAFACNWTNRVTVALACHITFTAPARVGDLLVAEAREVHRAGRTGVYDVTVTREDGTTVAVFRGNSYTTRGKVVAELPFADELADAATDGPRAGGGSAP